MELRGKLEQYCDLLQEVKVLRERINKLQKTIEGMEEDGYVVSDAVKGTKAYGMYGSITITGFPYPEYADCRRKLRDRVDKLTDKEKQLFDALSEVDDYINAISDSKLRQVFTLRYLDERGLAWHQVANIMNSRYDKRKKAFTGDSCRMMHNRYLEIKGAKKNKRSNDE